ncbi:hypothetical protein [Xanthocytophaga agilis]|uniref:Uncharacterized protein n=1 Tax=Xanthocytophaga agilis TaxID=3048010 RepID=A0AAE3UDL0_9BACT|nr:hypothetical protein [Xanthocytophaga agilis]MDJ1500461.1 hypothetical protein [Xanthocytophaga agilis]
MIKLSEALMQMEQGETFSCKFVTFNQRRKTGGEIIEIQEARLFRQSASTPEEKKESSGKSKSPNHWANSTRNILILPSEQIRKLHIRLLIEFNGFKVIY